MTFLSLSLSLLRRRRRRHCHLVLQSLWSSSYSTVVQKDANRYHNCLAWTSPAKPILLSEFKELMKSFLSKYPLPISTLTRIAVAYSGGPDSLALLILLTKLFGASRVLAITINHNLPGYAEENIGKICKLIEPLKVQHEIVKLEWPEHLKIIYGNEVASSSSSSPAGNTIKISKLQQLSRDKRQEVFSEICRAEKIPLLVSGHHLDDDIVTFFYRFSRMSSLEGLASMKPLAIIPVTTGRKQLDHLLLGKPFLGIPKARLLETCRHYQNPSTEPNQLTPWVEDSSNSNDSFLRNDIRNGLIEMQRLDPLLTTQSLGTLLLNIKKAQEETKMQLRRALDTSVILGNSPTNLNPIEVLQNPFSSLQENTSVSHYPQTGDSTLIFPLDGRRWYFNRFLLSRMILIITQVVANQDKAGGYYTVYDFTADLTKSIRIRLAMSRRWSSMRDRLAAFHKEQDQRANYVVDQGEGASASPGGSKDAPATPAIASILPSNSPLPPESYDPTRRLPFLQQGCMMQVLIKPLGSRDAAQRVHFYQSSNADVLQSPNKDKKAISTNGPFMFLTPEPLNPRIAQSFHIDVTFIPGQVYIYDERLYLRFTYPHINDNSSEISMRNRSFEAISLPDTKNYKKSKRLEANEPKGDNTTDSTGNLEMNGHFTVRDLSGLAPPFTKSRNQARPIYHLDCAVESAIIGEINRHKLNLESPVPGFYESEASNAIDESTDSAELLGVKEELDDSDIYDAPLISPVVPSDHILPNDDHTVKPIARTFVEKSNTLIGRPSELASNTDPNNHQLPHVKDSTLAQIAPGFNPKETRFFRICVVTLDALKYMANIAYLSGQISVLEKLELFRQVTPVDCLHPHPLVIEPSTGFMCIPTLQITLLGKGMWDPVTKLPIYPASVPHWESKMVGLHHLFNKLYAPSY